MRAITLTPAEQRRAVALAHELLALLAPSGQALKPSDKELAEVLLPAWFLTLGNAVVTVKDMREVRPDTALGRALDRVDFCLQAEPHRAGQAIGELFGRLADYGQPVAGYVVGRRGTEGKAALWACSPLDAP